MTITTTDTVERYVGDGSQTTWPITFPFFTGEDVKACIVNSAGEQVNLSYGVDYTVTKSASSIGGIVQYALADGVELTIWLNLPITQGTDFYNTGPLNAETLEAAFDRLTLIAQQLQEASDRSIKVETSSLATPEELLVTLYAGRDAAVASASAAASSESNAAASAQAAATSASGAATSASAAAGSVITAEAWAESESAPDPNNAESKSAKSWALIASDNVPIATATLAGKAKASASWQVAPETGVATVPAATTSTAGIARQATDAEVTAGTENGPVFVTPHGVQQKINTLQQQTNTHLGGKMNLDLANVSVAGKETAIGWGMPDYDNAVPLALDQLYPLPCNGYINVHAYPNNQSSVYLTINGATLRIADSFSQGRNVSNFSQLYESGTVVQITASAVVPTAKFIPLKGEASA